MRHTRMFPNLSEKEKSAFDDARNDRPDMFERWRWETKLVFYEVADVFMYVRLGRRECKCAYLCWHAQPTRYNARYTRVHLYTLQSRTVPSWSAPDREIKERRTRKKRRRREMRSICKPRRIAYFKAITVRFSCPEDDGIALSFVRPAVKNDPR